MLKKYIGDKTFYRMIFTVMTPILIQNVITNFVSLLDNIMVGQVGTEPMSGVAIINQLIFVFNLCIFGGLAGAGIFSAQFYGNDDQKGVRDTFKIKMYIGIIIVILAFLIFGLFQDTLIYSFLHEGEENLDLQATFGYAKEYLAIMLIQLVPFMLTNVYGSTLKETGETLLPMKAGVIAVFVNMTFNYLLIFGKFGFPQMGVAGAAIATVLSRFVEAGIIMVWTHRNPDLNPFIVGAYKDLRVPGSLVRQIIITGTPLLINETLWSAGMTVLNQCYSLKGLEVVSAVNISSTISNLFMCAIFASGTTISIVIGQLLGAGKLEEAVDQDRKLIFFSVAICVVIGLVMYFLAPIIPNIYNTSDIVKQLASRFLKIYALLLPFNSFTNCCYFTLRSGGKTIITFIFDSFFVWTVNIPTAFILVKMTTLGIVSLYAVVQALEIIKSVIGFIMVKQRKWVNNLVIE